MKNFNIKIERTNFEDLEKIANLYLEAFNEETDISLMKKRFKELEDNDNYIFISAKDGNKCVGFSALVISHNIFWQATPLATMWSSCVDKEYRNIGICKMMVEYAEKICIEKQCSFLTITTTEDNIPIKKIFNNRGYKKEVAYTKEFV